MGQFRTSANCLLGHFQQTNKQRSLTVAYGSGGADVFIFGMI